jgi:cell shape-determining protein MreC|tara:strand:+ start:4270 stop:4419 length:150 start_codon:yes stop_codon:yes gene_type:complete
MFKKIVNKIKSVFKKISDFLKTPYIKYKREKEYKKRLAELKKRDPFIYK